MIPHRAIFYAALISQIMSVMAESGVTIFNGDETKDDKMESLLQSESFIQVQNSGGHNQRQIKQQKLEKPQPNTLSMSPSQQNIPQTAKTKPMKQNTQPFNASSTINGVRTTGNNKVDNKSQLSEHIDLGHNKDSNDTWQDLSRWFHYEESQDEMYSNIVPSFYGDSFGEDHRRAKRAVSNAGPGSGDVGVYFKAVLNGTLTQQQLTDGSTESNSLKLAIGSQLTTYLKITYRGVLFDVQVISLEVPSISFTAEIQYDESAVDEKQLAQAMHDLDLKDNFKVGGAIYSMSSPMLSSTSSHSDFKAAICFLCREYRSCIQTINQDWICRVNDSHLYPFGFDVNDSTLPPNQEFVAARVDIDSSLPFGDELVNSVFISVNGLISFREEFTSFSPEPLPTFGEGHKQRMVLCPYWSDLDKVNSDIGEVFYQEYKKDHQVTRDVQTILDRANKDVATYSQDVSSYDASVVITATWSEMPPSPAEASDNERTTFQCIIITDGETTYTMFVYANRAMNFDPIMGRDVVVGYGASQLDSSRENFYRFDSVIGNTGQIGQWFFKIGYVPNNRAKCMDWYMSNMLLLLSIQQLNNEVLACPCNEQSARLSYMWIPSQLQDKCYDIFHLHDQGPYGRRCCYRDDGNFENRIPLAGNFQNSTPYYGDPISHEMNDAAPKRLCCAESDLCQLYYIVRPVHTCEAGTTVKGVLFGDPHIVTLDAQQFIFNGLGEYRLLEIDGKRSDNVYVNFTLQGKTCRVIGKNETQLNATIFCAIGMKNTIGTSLTVEISADKKYMIIYANDQDFSALFRDTPLFNINYGGIFLQKLNDSLKVSTPDDIGLTITLGSNLLDFSVEISTKYEKMTKGLMGNFNRDKNDDFQFPNGTILPNNTSERNLYNYGKSWTASKSIFSSTTGRSARSSDPEFVPIFLDEASVAQINAAQATCGSTTNLPCIYDFFATQNAGIARGSFETITTFHENVGKANNKPPVINGAREMNVTVNQTMTLTMTGSDPENDTFIFVMNSSPQNGALRNSTFGNIINLTYTATDLHEVPIGISAVDTHWQQSSEVAQVAIKLCSACSKHGTCNFARELYRVSPYFSVVTCNCKDPWAGEHCERDKDGCANKPCPLGTRCTDIRASEEELTKKAYNCSECPQGFLLNANNTKCEDINECLDIPSPCSSNSNCTNTYGSYICECYHGYRNISAHECKDIDECVEKQHSCTQICNNIDGGYECQCKPGFKLDVFGYNCSKDQIQIDVCKNMTHKCSYGCSNSSGIGQCFCPSGYNVAADGYSCEDIDECKEYLCSQECKNTNGSFTCSCYPGFKLDKDGLSCQFCSANRYGLGCKRTCDCRGREIYCDSVKGCICQGNWTGEHCETDVNECATHPHICPKDQICTNTIGSYTCTCSTGYKLTNGSCININECKDPLVHRCQQKCLDNTGSFTCTCYDGYTSINNICEDIDECKTGTSGCMQICVNMPGRFNCDCHDGYYLDYDRKACIRDLDPCQHLNVTCDYVCNVVNGKPVCYCPVGFTLASNGITCLDVDECWDKSELCTDQCVNTNGSYECTCPSGKQLQNDKRSCQVCNKYHWGPNCASDCACNPQGSKLCDPVSGCKCKDGWGGINCNADVDECSESQSVCSKSSTCYNTPGSYICQCIPGYQLDSNNMCIDKDECLSNSPCQQICTNTEGSYTCSCYSGFRSQGDICVDINECAVPVMNGCNQICRNTKGGFACECYEGYVLSTTNRGICNQKALDPNCAAANCSDFCSMEKGQPKCFCKSGYQLDSDNITCVDVNECKNNPCVNGNCTNMNGTFACECLEGTMLAADNVTCEVCAPGFFGLSCQNSCICNKTNTKQCLPSNGTCECHVGWNGDDCSEDINECTALNRTNCGENADCEDTPGSYKCVCTLGFFRTSVSTCDPCDNSHYGQDCKEMCSCIMANTKDCNDTTGNCTCNPGWQGDTCDEDINECSVNSSYCPGAHDKCVNLNGSAECRCDLGYYRPVPADDCQDINECEHNYCLNGDCTNLNGTFACDCPEGRKLTADNVTCEACNATQYGHDCQQTCRCFTNNTKDCNDTTGNCTCNPGWQGDTCDEDIDECSVNSSYCPGVNDKCVNLNGSAECRCDLGYYRPVPGDDCQECDVSHYGQDCKEMCSCIMTNTKDCNDTTGNCTCNPGWQGDTCDEDIDECSVNSSYCPGVNDKCVNLNGSAKCECDTDYYRPKPGDDCQACNATQYGHDCQQTCRCFTNNTKDCNDTTGNCTCNPGWQGDTCDEDIDECSVNSSYCPGVNDKCVNLNGSAECRCDLGYYRPVPGDDCQECDVSHYGQDCKEMCSCIMTNTKDCNDTTGNCTCNPGWQGDTCDEDIDECSVNSSYCPGAHDKCVNLNGSAKCECDTDYYRPKPGDDCQVSFVAYHIEITLLYTKDQYNSEVFNSSSTAFTALSEVVRETLFSFGRQFQDQELLRVTITNFRSGSIIVSATFDIDKRQSNDPPASIAKVASLLKMANSLLINNTRVLMGNVSLENITLTTGSKCEALTIVAHCKLCDENSGKCLPTDNNDKDNTDLIIGLAVGIPSFVILIAAVVLFACLYTRRKRTTNEGSDTPSVDTALPFRNKFAYRASTKGSWGAPNRMFAPDEFSRRGSNAYGDLVNERQRDHFGVAGSLWYYNSRDSQPEFSEHRQVPSEAAQPTSNFSWDKMFQLLEPHKNFELQRPNLNISSNPMYTGESNTDSMIS